MSIKRHEKVSLSSSIDNVMYTRAILALTLVLVCVSASAGISSDTAKTRVIRISLRKNSLKEIGPLPRVLKEASGLEFTGKTFWTHNDDGIPAIYSLDSAGNLIRALHLNSVNRGWEDLAQDEQGSLFIGSFGNNKNDRRDLKIYRIPNPDSIAATLTIPEIIHYTYSDQTHFPPDKTNRNYDVDAFIAWKNSLYLFTKNRSLPFEGYSKVYRLKSTPGTQVAELIDSLYVGDGPMINNWITAADLSPDGKTLALLFHDRLWLMQGFSETRFSNARVYEVNLEHYTHKAGMCFYDANTLFIVDELEAGVLGGKFYSLDLTDILPRVKR